MRVLHVHSGNLYGGVETFLSTLARNRALCPNMEPAFALCFEGRLSRELLALKMPVHFLGATQYRKPWSVWRARRTLRRLLEKGGPTHLVCHSPWSQALFGAVARRRSLPQVLFLHGALGGRHWIERLAFRSAPTGVLANSDFTARSARKFYPAASVKTIHCPSEVVPVPASERPSVRAELEVPGEEVVIVQVSRMEEGKGHALHLRALAQLKDLPQWRCWMVGGGQREGEVRYMKSLEDLARDLGIEGRVRFLGQREDVPRLLAAADVYCQPNTGPEGFGLSFIEALAASIPVVTTDMGAAPEIVDSRTGLLVPPEPFPVAEALRRMIVDPAFRRRTGAAGPARARLLCDPAQQLGQLAAALSQISSRRPNAITSVS